MPVTPTSGDAPDIQSEQPTILAAIRGVIAEDKSLSEPQCQQIVELCLGFILEQGGDSVEALKAISQATFFSGTGRSRENSNRIQAMKDEVVKGLAARAHAATQIDMNVPEEITEQAAGIADRIESMSAGYHHHWDKVIRSVFRYVQTGPVDENPSGISSKLNVDGLEISYPFPDRGAFSRNDGDLVGCRFRIHNQEHIDYMVRAIGGSDFEIHVVQEKADIADIEIVLPKEDFLALVSRRVDDDPY
ncbi:hypothetical protein HN748_04000 [Candidatus Peregrinibacteria bacterium]|nr:hypothetical protein [Candidatus Peregrinibacteria bacterium]MBT7483635.1 hypothetical protein [Candidatus Peregrinibacteria bacterium]MBT7703372.1 hypothetical protein [Candidatus Peregrinibacteria bacterium]